MKKNLIRAAIISLGVNLVFFAVNLICANTMGVLPLGRTYPGGDCIERIGFGVNLLKIFPMTTADNPGAITRVLFEPRSLILPLVIGFLIALIVLQLHSAKNTNA